MDKYSGCPKEIRSSRAFAALEKDIKSHGLPKYLKMGNSDYRYVNAKYPDGYWNSYIMTNDYDDTNAFWKWASEYFKQKGVQIKYQKMVRSEPVVLNKEESVSMNKSQLLLEEDGGGLNQAQISSLNKVVGDLLKAKINFKYNKSAKNTDYYTCDVTEQAGIFRSVIKSMDLVAIFYPAEKGAVLELTYQHGNLSESGSNGIRLGQVYIIFQGDTAKVHYRS